MPNEVKYKVDKRDIFLRGENIFLKALNKQDIIESNWYGWFNDEKLCENLQKHYFPNTLEEQVDYFNKNIFSSSTKLQLGIFKYEIEKLLGVISLNDIDYINRKAEMSVIIGEPEGKDTVTLLESWKLLLNHGFNTLNLNKIYSGTVLKEIVILMKKTIGFVEEGVLRQDVFKNGKYLDVYYVSILKDEFNRKFSNYKKSNKNGN